MTLRPFMCDSGYRTQSMNVLVFSFCSFLVSSVTSDSCPGTSTTYPRFCCSMMGLYTDYTSVPLHVAMPLLVFGFLLFATGTHQARSGLEVSRAVTVKCSEPCLSSSVSLMASAAMTRSRSDRPLHTRYRCSYICVCVHATCATDALRGLYV